MPASGVAATGMPQYLHRYPELENEVTARPVCSQTGGYSDDQAPVRV